MMSGKLYCLRCHTPMRCIGSEKLQLGQTGWILGDWPNLLAGALPVAIFVCPDCGKLEFFLQSRDDEEEEALPQRTCPKCGAVHDFDYPKCPKCRYDYYA